MKKFHPPLSGPERVLVIVLRALGIFDMFALVAVVMPFEWSAIAHAALGMGELPEKPIVDYLICSTSLLYALHAAMILYVSCDVRRYGPFITFFARVTLVHGTVLGLIDWRAGMPLWWRIQEPVAYWVIGSVVLLLQRLTRRILSETDPARP